MMRVLAEVHGVGGEKREVTRASMLSKASGSSEDSCALCQHISLSCWCLLRRESCIAEHTCTPTRPTDRPTLRTICLLAANARDDDDAYTNNSDDDYRDAARYALAKPSALKLQNGGAAVSVS